METNAMHKTESELMTDDAKKQQVIDRIRQNIIQHGHHIYVVSGGAEPRFAYTIGLREQFGAELILAGAIFYMLDDVIRIINDIVANMKSHGAMETAPLEIGTSGAFTLRKVHPSWSTTLMLGALDFYKVSQIQTLQLIPDAAHWTIDVPDMSEPWSATTAPVWQWLQEPWTYPVSSKSTVVTNLAALRGERVTEATRWEQDEWELFAGAGPDVSKDEVRVVPLGTLVAADQSLKPIFDLPIGGGAWRNAISDWHPWGKSEQTEGT